MQIFTKKFYVYVFCLLLSPSLLYSAPDFVIEEITTGDLSLEKDLFVQEFAGYYRTLNTTITDPMQKLPEITDAAFEDEEKDFEERKPGTYFFRTTCEGRVVGYASFEKTDNEHEVYIRQLVVDSKFERKSIGRTIGFDAVFNSLPDTNHVVVITRRSNDKALRFYKKLGFTECPYMHEGYSAEKYVGLEFFKKN